MLERSDSSNARPVRQTSTHGRRSPCIKGWKNSTRLGRGIVLYFACVHHVLGRSVAVRSVLATLPLRHKFRGLRKFVLVLAGRVRAIQGGPRRPTLRPRRNPGCTQGLKTFTGRLDRAERFSSRRRFDVLERATKKCATSRAPTLRSRQR